MINYAFNAAIKSAFFIAEIPVIPLAFAKSFNSETVFPLKSSAFGAATFGAAATGALAFGAASFLGAAFLAPPFAEILSN